MRAILGLFIAVTVASQGVPVRGGESLVPADLTNGFIVHLGCSDGSRTIELSQQGKFLVHALDADPGNVERTRQSIAKHRLNGRASAQLWSGSRLPYASNLVNVLVADQPGQISEEEILRVLRPLGVAHVKRNSGWKTLTKPWPREFDDWTHRRHGPNGNPVSQDTALAPSLRPQWLEGPTWIRDPFLTTRAMVSAGGRLFYVIDEMPSGSVGNASYHLLARDAFNGLLLWKRQVRSFSSEHLVASRNRVFLYADGELLALNAADGTLVRSFGRFNSLYQIVHDGDVLVVNLNSAIRVMNPETGENLWQHAAKRMRQVIVNDGRVFGMDDNGQRVVCLDRATGAERWRKEFDRSLLAQIDFAKNGLLVLGRETMKTKEIVCLSADNGSLLWRHEVHTANRRLANCLMYANGLIWVNAHAKAEKFREWKGLEPLTGEVKKKIEYPYVLGITHSCFPDYATEKFLITGRMGFADLSADSFQMNPVFRGSCLLGRIPANGMLYSFPSGCQCYAMDRGVLGLAPRDKQTPAPPIAAQERLRKGPAYGQPIVSNPQTSDWPTWRHDARRSGSTAAALPRQLALKWSTAFAGAATAPVVAEGMLLTAISEHHQIAALDAESGKLRWTYTADARIDSPPTIHKGVAIVGSRDGWVHCVRLSDGQLAWRYHAAPAEQLIFASSQLESSWPISGSILVVNDVAYFAVGRLADPDDGPCILGLDVRSGALVREEKAPGHIVCDVLTSDRNKVHLGEFSIDLSGAEIENWPGRLKPICVERDGAHHTLLDLNWYKRRDISDDRGVVAQKLVFQRDRSFGFIVGNYAPGMKIRIYDRPSDSVGFQLFAVDAAQMLLWKQPLPMRVSALLANPTTLFAAGAKDAGFGETAREPALWAISPADGRKLWELPLQSAVISDGLAATPGRLFVTTEDRRIHCLAE